MLGNLIMIGGVGLLSASFIYRKKQSYFKDLYDQIERSKKYHLDFVDELGKLPLNQNVILFGPPKSQTNSDRILCKSIIKKGPVQEKKQQGQQKKQFQFPKEDRLWKFSLKEPFYLQTLSKQKIIVQQQQGAELYAFNLMRRNSNQKWQERVIVKNQPVCAYGKIINTNGKMHFKTTLIMGTKNETFLNYLDNQIIKLRSRGKQFTFVGISIFAIHIAYLQLFVKKSQKPIMTQGVKQPATPEDQILSDIKKFEKQTKK